MTSDFGSMEDGLMWLLMIDYLPIEDNSFFCVPLKIMNFGVPFLKKLMLSKCWLSWCLKSLIFSRMLLYVYLIIIIIIYFYLFIFCDQTNDLLQLFLLLDYSIVLFVRCFITWLLFFLGCMDRMKH